MTRKLEFFVTMCFYLPLWAYLCNKCIQSIRPLYHFLIVAVTIGLGSWVVWDVTDLSSAKNDLHVVKRILSNSCQMASQEMLQA